MNVLDLFCGAVGGWSGGLEDAGFRTVAACELDDWRRAVFAAGHPGCRMYADVRELTADRLLADLGFLPDVIVGSPPCQEVSAANSKGKGITDDHPFWDFTRLVLEIRPLWCAAENSPRARTNGIDGILDALEQANYACWPLVVGADNAGANHRRKRLWLFAADAERIELWEQSWRRCWANRRDAAVFGDDAEYSSVVSGLRFGGIRGIGGDQSAQAHLPDDPDIGGKGSKCSENGGCHGGGCIDAAVGAITAAPVTTCGIVPAITDSDATRERCLEGRPREASPWNRRQLAGNLPANANANGTRHALGPRLGSDDGAELPAALCDIGLGWPHWNGGVAGLSAACAAAGFGSLDDGSNTIMAPNLRNRCIGALGDAVVKQIPEAIGRAVVKLSKAAAE